MNKKYKKLLNNGKFLDEKFRLDNYKNRFILVSRIKMVHKFPT